MGVYICVCICVHTHGCQVEATVMSKTLLDYKVLHAFQNYIYICTPINCLGLHVIIIAFAMASYVQAIIIINVISVPCM